MSTDRNINVNVQVDAPRGGGGGGRQNLRSGARGGRPGQARPARSSASASQREAVNQFGQLASRIPGGGRAAGAVRGIAAGAAAAPLLGVTAGAGAAALALGAVAVAASKASDNLNTAAALERRAARTRFNQAKDRFLANAYGDKIAAFQTAALNRLTDTLIRLNPGGEGPSRNSPIPFSGGASRPPSPPGAEEGGIVRGSRTGSNIRAGENRKNEAIVPLSGNNSLKIQIQEGVIEALTSSRVQQALNRFQPEDVPFRTLTVSSGAAATGTGGAGPTVEFLTQTEYDALVNKDSDTIYSILEDPSG